MYVHYICIPEYFFNIKRSCWSDSKKLCCIVDQFYTAYCWIGLDYKTRDESFNFVLYHNQLIHFVRMNYLILKRKMSHVINDTHCRKNQYNILC